MSPPKRQIDTPAFHAPPAARTAAASVAATAAARLPMSGQSARATLASTPNGESATSRRALVGETKQGDDVGNVLRAGDWTADPARVGKPVVRPHAALGDDVVGHSRREGEIGQAVAGQEPTEREPLSGAATLAAWPARSSSPPSERRSGSSAAGLPPTLRRSSGRSRSGAALERSGVGADDVQYVIMGQVLQAGAGQAPARQAAVGAGIPKEVPADTINKVCASSVRAVEIADSMIRAGDVEVVVAGGMESMSSAPYLVPKARFGYRLGDGELVDSMVFDGLTSTFDGMHMVEQASFVSRELGICARRPGSLGAALARAGGARDRRRALRRRARRPSAT